MRDALRSALLVAFLVAAAGCAQPLASRSGVRMEPAGSAEANLHLQAGDTITWEWSATQPVHFNVHTHTGAGVQELLTQDASEGHGSFTAPVEGPYSLLWENRTAQAVTLSYVLQGTGVVTSTLPA